jgi:hypothetical protein
MYSTFALLNQGVVALFKTIVLALSEAVLVLVIEYVASAFDVSKKLNGMDSESSEHGAWGHSKFRGENLYGGLLGKVGDRESSVTGDTAGTRQYWEAAKWAK